MLALQHSIEIDLVVNGIFPFFFSNSQVIGSNWKSNEGTPHTNTNVHLKGIPGRFVDLEKHEALIQLHIKFILFNTSLKGLFVRVMANKASKIRSYKPKDLIELFKNWDVPSRSG